MASLATRSDDHYLPLKQKNEAGTKPNVIRALAGGFIGTAVLTLMMYKVAPIMMGKAEISQQFRYYTDRRADLD